MYDLLILEPPGDHRDRPVLPLYLLFRPFSLDPREARPYLASRGRRGLLTWEAKNHGPARQAVSAGEIPGSRRGQRLHGPAPGRGLSHPGRAPTRGIPGGPYPRGPAPALAGAARGLSDPGPG